ncbi:MAG: dihydrofolate reductase [Nanobdellota archaeon]
MKEKIKTQTISIIAAMSENKVIGNNLKIPWNIPEEKKRFKELTLNKTIIMGRKTFESIGKPLPKRNTIVLSRQKKLKIPSCKVVNRIKDALDLCEDENEIFIAGGAEIYNEFLPITDNIYLTIIHKNFLGNIFFPEFHKDFKIIHSRPIEAEIPYTYNKLRRITPKRYKLR